MALAGVLTLTGCAASDGPTAARPTPTDAEPTTVADAQSAPVAVTDAETCAALGDVVTIRHNVDVAVHEGRMTSKEQLGWYRLATSVFDRVPTRGEGSVSEAVADLQAMIPPVAPGTLGTSLVGTDEWEAAFTVLVESCADAGSEITGQGFTGG